MRKYTRALATVVTEELYAKVDELAARLGITKSDFVRMAVQEKVAREEGKAQ
ncbi:ribbon-helix-helix protein, CopG family [Infirmifilum lucidum]|uniref:Ribbon-helix-helix protein, CopG family n=1 Tax=Infirmifilum lucidum TaxID=2776706 RepID=A0A7L9FIE3_9CREN|nr:ribbon-helix-helix protein, CopG family [Infirmifilum lucidum]QOJ78793.1 ribbon-helix-helix protein, CopG family [Infirmifilum lucidum]